MSATYSVQRPRPALAHLAPSLFDTKEEAMHRATMARVKTVKSTCVQPVFVNGNHAVIRWVFEFAWLDGKQTRIEEPAYQRWKGEFIAQETFFYDPAQFVVQ